jgi:hypothetical protein
VIRLGVVRPEQFFASPPKQLLPYIYYRLSRGRVSFRLLRSADDETFERLMRHVQLSNGVHRTTFRNRFRELDPVVNRVLANSFSGSEELAVEDWAASACLTSCDWAESLFPIFPRLQFAASDLAVVLVDLEDTRSGEVFITEESGHALQYVRGSLVIRMEPPETWAAPVNRLLYMRAQKRSEELRQVWPLPDEWLDLTERRSLDRGNYRLSKLPLIHPKAMDLASNDQRFSVRRHSAFDALRSPVHVIRTMNILNRAYFSDDRLAGAARTIVSSLRHGGIWIVGRTTEDNPPVHEVSVFRKADAHRIEVVERLGPGSEIEGLALQTVGGAS